MPTTNEMQERLAYESSINLKLHDTRRALEDSINMHQTEILRLRASLDKTQTFAAHIEAEYEKLKSVTVEISRGRIHGKPTVAAALALKALDPGHSSP